jgi:hypothetical protein
VQLWEHRSSEYKPVSLALNATPRNEFAAAKVKVGSVARRAHEADHDVTCVRWHRDGTTLASRSTDGTLKLWDVRRFEEPLAAWGGLDCNFAMAGCDFSPDGSMLCCGTSVKKGQGTSSLAFVSTLNHEKVADVPMDGASVVPLLWHNRLNQIVLGSADGSAYVLYDPDVSEKGALYCATKAPPRRGAIAYTGHLANGIIMTPHALPMYKDEELNHRKKRRQDRNDPLKSRKPEQITSGPSTGGTLKVGYQQALLASLPGGVSGLSGTKDKIAAFEHEDPREEILKYAKIAEEQPLYVTPAYGTKDGGGNQPQVAAGTHLAATVDEEEEEEEK